jgi:hypothetical protein
MFRDNDIDDINIHIDKIKNDAAMKYKMNYEPTLQENMKVYKVIQNYIKKNERIIYGGFAQHLLIKKKIMKMEYMKKLMLYVLISLKWLIWNFIHLNH